KGKGTAPKAGNASGSAAKVRKKDTGESGNLGEFGTLTRSEADITVTPADDPQVRYLTVGWFNNKLASHFDASALLTRAEVEANKELLNEDEGFERIREDANKRCRRRGAMQPLDDVIGDTAHDGTTRIRHSEHHADAV